MAVYYQDPAETGAGAFDVTGRPLTDYATYLDFVLGTRVRSLYDTGITVGDSASFLTLASAPAADGTRLCVTGRLIADNENAQLAAALIEQRTDPLLPAARYQAQGQAMPDVSTQMSQEMEWYLNAGVDVAAFDDGAGTDANGTAAGGPGVDTRR